MTIWGLPILCAVAMAVPLAAQPAQPMPTADQPAPLRLMARAERPAYAIGAPISLLVDLSQPAFLYAYSRGPDGTAQMVALGGLISPVPQPAGQALLANVLAGNAEADEELVVFASTARLPLPAALGSMATRDLESRLAALGVSVGPRAGLPAAPGLSAPVVSALRIDLPALATISQPVSPAIAPPVPTPPPAPPAGLAVPMLNSSKPSYKVGEAVEIIVGSSAAGQVQIFVREAGGEPVALTSLRFDRPGVQTVRAVAAPPAGSQTIIAVHSPDGKVTAADLAAAGFAAQPAAKAISLRPSPPPAVPLAIDTHIIKVEN